jgi:hypothetical protein
MTAASTGWSASVSRRCVHSAGATNASCDSLVVTHPFHPLRGQRLAVLFERRYADGRLYVCEGGPFGTIGVPEDATDRVPPPASGPLTGEVLAGLVGLVAAIIGTDARRCP